MKQYKTIIIVLLLFMVSFISLVNNASAEISYQNTNFDDGGWHDWAPYFSPNGIVTTESYSHPYSMYIGSGGSVYYSKAGYSQPYEFAFFDFEYFPVSCAAGTGNDVWKVYNATDASQTLFYLTMDSSGELYIRDLTTALTNDTGLSLTMNDWNLIQIQMIGHYYKIAINGHEFTSIKWSSSAIMRPISFFELDYVSGHVGYYDDIQVTDFLPFRPPHIISVPDVNVSYSTNYIYLPIADQPGNNWTVQTNATWLTFTLSTYPIIAGISPIPESYGQNLSYWINVTFSNDNGTANQNYTLNVTGIQSQHDAVSWLTMTPVQSLFAVCIGAGLIFLLLTYLMLRRRKT
jgi:hypothetical protein